MVNSHCEILWAKHSVEGLGFPPTAYYVAAADDAEKQAPIAQQRLRYKMLNIFIINTLTTDVK